MTFGEKSTFRFVLETSSDKKKGGGREKAIQKIWCLNTPTIEEWPCTSAQRRLLELLVCTKIIHVKQVVEPSKKNVTVFYVSCASVRTCLLKKTTLQPQVVGSWSKEKKQHHICVRAVFFHVRVAKVITFCVVPFSKGRTVGIRWGIRTNLPF